MIYIGLVGARLHTELIVRASQGNRWNLLPSRLIVLLVFRDHERIPLYKLLYQIFDISAAAVVPANEAVGVLLVVIRWTCIVFLQIHRIRRILINT